MNSHRTILSLCDYTGIFADAYRRRGYEVIQVDLQHGQDVRLMKWPGRVIGIIAQPPCTHFSRAGAWKWKEKGEAALLEGLAIVDACLRCVAVCRPEWWVLENPIGRLQDYIGPPAFKFNPCDFGDAYTKRTWLWGNFTPPSPLFVPKHCQAVTPARGKYCWTESMNGGKDRQNKRSATAPGFAEAFASCNQ
jgi:hypothetical protein